MSSPSPDLEYLVLDAGGIIKGNAMELFTKAKHIVTIAEVFGEIRDSKAREVLDRLPYEITEMTPSPLAVKAVFDFAKKTGDFAALSKTDLKLIALTYQLSGKMEQPAATIDPSIAAIRTGAGAGATGPESNAGAGAGAGAGAVPVGYTPLRAPAGAWRTVSSQKSPSPWSKVVGEAPENTDSGSMPAADESSATTPHTPEEEESCMESDTHLAARVDAHTSEEKSDYDNEEDDGEVDYDDYEDEEDEEDSDAEAEEMDDETRARVLTLQGEAGEENFPSLEAGARMEALHPLSTVEQQLAELNRSAAARLPVKAAWGLKIGAGNSVPVSAAAPASDAEGRPDANTKASADGTTSAPSTTTSDKTQSNTSNIMRSSGLAGGMKAEMDDGTGWINNSNIKGHLSSSGCSLGIATSSTATHAQTTGTSKSARARARKARAATAAAAEAELRARRAACVTADFSMQNVLMQMGLSIYSIDGLLIKSIKQWVLRCMACYQIHYQMDRLFCSKCGASHMSRVACSIDSKTGELKLHLKSNYRRDLRGTKYNLPNPGRQGKYDGELLMREDQLLSGVWRQKTVMIKKDVKSIFGEQVTSDVGLHINKSQGIKLGLGQRNPNAAKGRERRGKKKK